MSDAPSGRAGITPMRFVLWFGIVSMLSDVVYEGARSVVGPYLATLGASAALVGLVTGAGEAVALIFRLFSGRAADRSGRLWPLSIAGYGITMVSVPLLAVASAVLPASGLVILERFGKAVRAPAKDTMLAHAGTDIGHGRTFAIHGALDQIGAFAGPLAIAAAISLSGGYELGFAILAVPGTAAMLVLLGLRRRAPHPERFDRDESEAPEADDSRHEAGAGGSVASGHDFATGDNTRLPREFWLYSAFTTATMTGFATFAVLAYHLAVRDVMADATIPIVYAAAMAAAAVGSLIFGHAYDRAGLKGLAVAPFLAAAVPFLSFTTSTALVWVGAIIWGLAMGMHESTMRAAVATMVPKSRRGTGYGTFTAVYGVAWLFGGTMIGILYERSVASVEVFVIATQIVALVLLVPLLGGRQEATARD